ncbi:RNA polymerase I specific transcription initiation factor [Acrodontium crateriforme]|uniref:RNA polymerase I specific transcription initiation factor n=1 Tax=Acrodontium crateriforme TaxID=150365 RepID=A0AAQ3R9C6_9PEZI|nr:RNA polymerase I specific transcription initiation factor [Acrodontium crateriforme]
MSSVGDEFSDPAFAIDENEIELHSQQPQRDDEHYSISSSLGPQTQADSAYDDSDVEHGDDRENRFRGPSSTWHAYTHEERALAASLDRLRANDLSIHLYNAHALKARLRDSTKAESWRSKGSWIKPDEDGKRPWQPDPDWTAWPLVPARVPFFGEDFGAPPQHIDDDKIYRKYIAWNPSADIEDEIKAIMLRKAKQRYESRPLAEKTPSRQPHINANLALDDGDCHDVDMADGKTGIINPLFDFEDADVPIAQKTMTPVILADDEQADAVIKPSVRHIVTKLDDLLIGLQKSRRAHRQRQATSRSRSQSIVTCSRLQSPQNSDEPVKPVNKRQKRRRAISENDSDEFRSPDESEAESDNGNLANSRTSTPKRTRPSGDSTHPLGQRDWSEILGIAALVGWDPAVIDRAARRCALLFGEGMSFRAMPETAALATLDRKTDYVPEMLPSIETHDDQEDEILIVEAPVLQGYFCPVNNCPRHHQAYAKAWRWREHLKRAHKFSQSQIDYAENDIPGSRNDSRVPLPDESILSEGKIPEAVIPHEDEYDGVRTDGFLKPILASMRRDRGGSKSNQPKGNPSNPNEDSEEE